MSQLSSSLKPMAAPAARSSSRRTAASFASARTHHVAAQDTSEGTATWDPDVDSVPASSYNSNAKGHKTSKSKRSAAFVVFIALLLFILGCLVAYFTTAASSHITARPAPAVVAVVNVPRSQQHEARSRLTVVAPPRVVHHGLARRTKGAASTIPGAPKPLQGMRPMTSKDHVRAAATTRQFLAIAAEVSAPLATYSRPSTMTSAGGISKFTASIIRGSVAAVAAGSRNSNGPLVVCCTVVMSMLLRLVIKYKGEGLTARARKAMIDDLKEHIKEIHTAYEDALERNKASIAALEHQLSVAMERAHHAHALLEQERSARINNRNAALSKVRELQDEIRQRAGADEAVIRNLQQERALVTGALTSLVRSLTELRVIDKVASGSNVASPSFINQLTAVIADKLGDQKAAVLDLLDTAEAQQTVIDMFRQLNEAQYNLPPARGTPANDNDALVAHLKTLIDSMHRAV